MSPRTTVNTNRSRSHRPDKKMSRHIEKVTATKAKSTSPNTAKTDVEMINKEGVNATGDHRPSITPDSRHETAPTASKLDAIHRVMVERLPVHKFYVSEDPDSRLKRALVVPPTLPENWRPAIIETLLLIRNHIGALPKLAMDLEDTASSSNQVEDIADQLMRITGTLVEACADIEYFTYFFDGSLERRMRNGIVMGESIMLVDED